MSRDQGAWSRIGFYSAAVFPALLFAGYGVFSQNLVAMAVAFGGLFFFVIWMISQELSHIAPYISVFQKVMAHEQRAAHAQQSAGTERA